MNGAQHSNKNAIHQPSAAATAAATDASIPGEGVAASVGTFSFFLELLHWSFWTFPLPPASPSPPCAFFAAVAASPSFLFCSSNVYASVFFLFCISALLISHCGLFLHLLEPNLVLLRLSGNASRAKNAVDWRVKRQSKQGKVNEKRDKLHLTVFSHCCKRLFSVGLFSARKAKELRKTNLLPLL